MFEPFYIKREVLLQTVTKLFFDYTLILLCNFTHFYGKGGTNIRWCLASKCKIYWAIKWHFAVVITEKSLKSVYDIKCITHCTQATEVACNKLCVSCIYITNSVIYVSCMYMTREFAFYWNFWKREVSLFS